MVCVPFIVKWNFISPKFTPLPTGVTSLAITINSKEFGTSVSTSLCRASIECRASDACLVLKEEKQLPLASLFCLSWLGMAIMLLCLLQLAAPLCSYSVTIRFYLFWLNTPWEWLLTHIIDIDINISVSIYMDFFSSWFCGWVKFSINISFMVLWYKSKFTIFVMNPNLEAFIF